MLQSPSGGGRELQKGTYDQHGLLQHGQGKLLPAIWMGSVRITAAIPKSLQPLGGLCILDNEVPITREVVVILPLADKPRSQRVSLRIKTTGCICGPFLSSPR